MNDLDPATSDLLARFQRASTPSVRQTAAGLVRVEARIAAMLAAPASARVRPSSLRRTAGALGVSLALAAGVLLAVHWVVGGTRAVETTPASSLDAASDVPSGERSQSVVVPMAPAEIAEPTSIDPPVTTADRRAPATADDRADPIAPTAAASPRRVAAPSSLELELAQITAARRERDAGRSLVLLERHAREFPDGVFAREREMMRAERLCDLGRVTEARALVQRFIGRYGEDVLSENMRRTCASP